MCRRKAPQSTRSKVRSASGWSLGTTTYCYVNGQKHLLNGYGHRNLYPALGSAVPADLQWKDVKLMADSGANLLRVGHAPAFVETVKACDAYGIMVLLDSGDNERTLEGEPA